jgi:hypothetical protein
MKIPQVFLTCTAELLNRCITNQRFISSKFRKVQVTKPKHLNNTNMMPIIKLLSKLGDATQQNVEMDPLWPSYINMKDVPVPSYLLNVQISKGQPQKLTLL